MPFQIGNLFLTGELLAAELIFLYPAPRRHAAALRLAVGALAALLAASCLPWVNIPGLIALPYIIRSIALFVLSVAVMALPYNLPLPALISMCVAGYAVQHIAYRASWLLGRTPLLAGIAWGPLQRDRVLELLCVAVVYSLMLATFGRFSAKQRCYQNYEPLLSAVSLLIVFICVVLTRLPRMLGGEGISVVDSIYSILCCYLALFIQFNLYRAMMLTSENRLMERLRQEERKQYEITKDTIDSINIKVHDVKHKLAAYRGSLPPEELDDLQRDIDIYDSLVKTGNAALDVLLTEKSIRCQHLGIRLSCAGDASTLGFMKTADLYSLFGNAVDNAMEAVERLEEEKRLIDVSIEPRGDFVFLSFVNYFAGTLEVQDGLPRTTKTAEPGYHGFGLKSIRRIAEKYGGDLSASAKGEMFHLDIYLHCREPQD